MFKKKRQRPILSVYYDGGVMYCLLVVTDPCFSVKKAKSVPAHEWALELRAIKSVVGQVLLAVPSAVVTHKSFSTSLQVDVDIACYIQLHQAELLTELSEQILFDFQVQSTEAMNNNVKLYACCKK